MSSANRHRPEIQALRALAVVLVVVYHLQPLRLPGGYIGVDVFFVISGFLITSHLLREVDETGTIRLTHFYARRIRRLLPASFTVLLASAVFVAVWLPKSLWEQTFKEIGSAAVYGLNWMLAANSTDYLAAENEASIVQHYWSLAVEEQFYIVWPGLMLAALFLARKALRGNPVARRVLFPTLAAVCIVSLLLSVAVTAKSQPFAYFITPTRMWEFAAGGLLALLPLMRPLRLGLASAASWIGIALILASAWLLDGESAFPGWLALAPVTGTVLVIWAGHVEHPWSPSQLMTFGPVQFVGDISYGIYLWHWPLIILYPVLRGVTPGARGSLLIAALSVLLAWLTKVAIEDPVRSGRYWQAKRRRAYSLAAVGSMATILVSAVGLVVISDLRERAGRPQPSFASLSALSEEIERSVSGETPFVDLPGGTGSLAPEWIADKCLDTSPSNVRSCRYGRQDATHTVVVLGDSVAISWMPTIRGAFEPHGWVVQPLTLRECGLADVRTHSYGKTEEYTECNEHRAWAFEQIAAMKPDLVISSNYVRGAVGGLMGKGGLKEWSAGAEKAFAKLAATGVPVMILGYPPSANCVKSPASESVKCKPGFDTNYYKAEREIAIRFGFTFVDTSPWFCTPAGVCPQYIGSTLVRADGLHLTGSFAKRLDLVLAESIPGTLNSPKR